MITLGIDNLLQEHSELLRGKRIGIFSSWLHHTAEGRPTIEALVNRAEWNVTALFGPEHGIETKAQYMEAVASGRDTKTGLKVFSLYGNTSASLSPTPEMLDQIDILVVDCQDIGSRYYTYVWSLLFCMRALAAQKKTGVICDRPNPIGGLELEGGGIQRGYESFCGMHSIPNRHAMTMGELAMLLQKREKLSCELQVIPTSGWKRGMHWPDTELPWLNPSPNMRSYHAALLYPGMCLLEGTNCSEGRGTDAPFEVAGAPYMMPEEVIGHLEEAGINGIAMHPIEFVPTFEKWKRKTCRGIRWEITDVKIFRPYLHGLLLIWTLHKLYGKKGFEWRTAPYEFVKGIPAIDLLTGSDIFRKRIDTRDPAEIAPLTEISPSFQEERQEFLLY